jgi:hypothetical protein
MNVETPSTGWAERRRRQGRQGARGPGQPVSARRGRRRVVSLSPAPSPSLVPVPALDAGASSRGLVGSRALTAVADGEGRSSAGRRSRGADPGGPHADARRHRRAGAQNFVLGFALLVATLAALLTPMPGRSA